MYIVIVLGGTTKNGLAAGLAGGQEEGVPGGGPHACVICDDEAKHTGSAEPMRITANLLKFMSDGFIRASVTMTLVMLI